MSSLIENMVNSSGGKLTLKEGKTHPGSSRSYTCSASNCAGILLIEGNTATVYLEGATIDGISLTGANAGVLQACSYCGPNGSGVAWCIPFGKSITVTIYVPSDATINYMLYTYE